MSQRGLDTARQLFVVAAALLQLASPFLFAVDWSAPPGAEGSPRNMEPTPLTPAGYAFIIWAPIYLGALAFAAFHALPSMARNDALRRIGWLAATGFVACAAWNGVVKYGLLWASVPIIAVMLASIGAAFVIASRANAQNQWFDVFVIAPLALYAGWLTVAAPINPSEVLPGYGFDRFGLSVESWSLAMLAAAAVIALAFLTFTHFNVIYAGAVIWGLTAVTISNFMRPDGILSLQLAAGAATALIIVLVAAMSWRLDGSG